jgi:ankyrin repeat protein
MSAEDPPTMTDEELAFAELVFDMARNGETVELETLIGRGVPVNLTNSTGDTPLVLAAEANTTIGTNTALAVAQQFGLADMERLLS